MLADLDLAYETADEMADDDNESTYSYESVQNEMTLAEQAKAEKNELACQAKKTDPIRERFHPVSSKKIENELLPSVAKGAQCKESKEMLYQVKYETILKLKESTRKLLGVLEELQSKTRGKPLNTDDTHSFTKLLKPKPLSNEVGQYVTDFIDDNAIKNLQAQAKTLDTIYIEEEDDCSVYKRLTRKCLCLNQNDYNDFVIHFNEDTKYRTSAAGEIIKNVRILKKFLYMDGGYTRNALLFLNEGLTNSSHTEKVEIIQGCAHADVCNVFDEHSIVVDFISGPCKNDYYGDAVIQGLTARFLYKLAQLEEGRRYLNLNSRICTDIKKVLRKKTANLEFETAETLNATLNLLDPQLSQNLNVTYYCKPIYEGVGKKTVQTLIQYRQYMTLDEVMTQLELLENISSRDSGKMELISYLPTTIHLFKRLLLEFDNSEMNILVTNIFYNIVSKNVAKEKESDSPKALIIADTATEPIQMKTQTCQIPTKKNNLRKINKSKLGLGISPNKYRNASRRKVSEREAALESVTNFDPMLLLSRSKKFTKEGRSRIIIVPVESKQ